MRTIYLLIVSFSISFYSLAQEKILDQCFVLVMESEDRSDLRNATFDLPFYAKRAVEGAAPEKIRHVMFDPKLPNGKGVAGLVVSSLRPYEYGEELKDNELAFFVLSWPNTTENVASFPAPNEDAISTDHFIIKEDLTLPAQLVEALDLSFSKLKAGKYQVSTIDFEY